MIRLKKMMALVIAMVMVICTMSMGTVFGAGDLTPDATITITGLDVNDTVHLYQVLTWTDGAGWTINPNYATLTTDGNTNFVQHVKDIVDNKKVELDKADLDKIAKVVKQNNPVEEKKITETPYVYNTVQAPGMYMALVTPGTAGVVYNPIIVSADFSATPNTSEIDASTAFMGTNGSVAKKEKVPVDKKSMDPADVEKKPKGTHNVGDIVKFEVTTKIPAYSDAYEAPSFKVIDTLSEGLEMVVDEDEHPFTVTCTVTGDSNNVAPKTGDKGFTYAFDSDGIAALVDYADVTITYYAKITHAAISNVNEEDNTIEVEFSNNPDDDDDKGKIKDKTKHYTFTIDGTLFGDSEYTTAEIVKVGLDGDGNPVESMVTASNGSSHSALDGAVFGLYTDEDEAKAASTNYYTNDVFQGTVETKNGGLMNIAGLDVGTYYLVELTAPKGFIKDTAVHTIVIDAVIEDEPVTETIDGIEVSYKVPVLKSYTITVDGAESAYTMTLDGPSISSVTPGDSTSEIVNTKGVELPATGGMGTTIFYAIGTILVLGAGVLLVTRRRMNME